MELDFITGDFAFVFNAEFLIPELERFDEKMFVRADPALGDDHFVRAHFPFTRGFTGEFVPINLEFVGVLLKSDLGIKLPSPFSGDGIIGGLCESGESQH
jgi:hypothetical protein